MSELGYREVLKDEEALSQFLRALKDFDAAFCDAMMSEVDFTLKLEVRGNRGELTLCKVDSGRWRRPGSEYRREKTLVG